MDALICIAHAHPSEQRGPNPRDGRARGPAGGNICPPCAQVVIENILFAGLISLEPGLEIIREDYCSMEDYCPLGR